MQVTNDKDATYGPVLDDVPHAMPQNRQGQEQTHPSTPNPSKKTNTVRLFILRLLVRETLAGPKPQKTGQLLS